jgi:hypothetical protein
MGVVSDAAMTSASKFSAVTVKMWGLVVTAAIRVYG